MRRIIVFFGLALAYITLALASIASAQTVQVGSCLAHTKAYSTISQAIAAVTAGSTVMVCPGSYPEQVAIAKAITLRGIQSNNTSNPTITVPPNGLTQSVTSGSGVNIYYQVLAQGTGTNPISILSMAAQALALIAPVPEIR